MNKNINFHIKYCDFDNGLLKNVKLYLTIDGNHLFKVNLKLDSQRKVEVFKLLYISNGYIFIEKKGIRKYPISVKGRELLKNFTKLPLDFVDIELIRWEMANDFHFRGEERFYNHYIYSNN